MSDMEDGEVLSSDNEEEECVVKQYNERKIELNDDHNKVENYDRWNYEQNTKKRESIDNKESDYEERSKNNHRHNERYAHGDQDRKRVHISHENNVKSRKRKSDFLNTDEILNENNVPLSKRRILCKYYAAGDCKNGTVCGFMHQDFPCKFFHYEGAICRAGNKCKYSHEPLSDEMKIVLDGFIQDGKEIVTHNSNTSSYNSESFIEKNTPDRPNCLLPTPVFDKPDINYERIQNDVCDSYSYNDLINYPEKAHFTGPPVPFYDKPIFNPNLPNYHIGNNLTFNQNYLSRPGTQEFNMIHENFHPRSGTQEFKMIQENFPPRYLQNNNVCSNIVERPPYFQPQLNNTGNSDPFYESNNHYNNHFPLPKEENMISNLPEERINLNYNTNHLNYKKHAPVRFIVGNIAKTLKVEPEERNTPEIFDIDFKDALKKLAEQVVTDPNRRSPSLEKLIENVPNEEKVEAINTSIIPMNIIKTEVSNVRIDGNVSIFKLESDMSESEKMYIEEMKSLINLNAQFEDTIPWKIHKLDLVQKQPYRLFKLNVDNVHDNPFADPRLNGHPVLNYIVKVDHNLPESSDDEEYESKSIIKEEEFVPEYSRISYLPGPDYRTKKIV